MVASTGDREMDGVLTDYGDGDGYGNGYGNGDIYGYGYGSGDIYGYGDGDIYGYGDGYGNGYGHGSGFGDGYGSGYGYGSGCGYGSGVVLGSVADYAVELLTPWNVIKIGCQIMSLDDWKAKWEKFANKHKMIVDKLVVESLIEKAMERVGE
jgi:hypothetical protein